MSSQDFTKKYNFFTRWWRGVDQATIIALTILFSVSLMLVTTASPAVALRIGLESSYFTTRQAAYLLLASIIIIVLSTFNKTWIKRAAIVGFAVNLILLVLVKFYGYEVKGARRWINIYGFSMQPTEFIKPFFSVITAWILSLKANDHNFPGFSIALFIYLIIAALVIIQPDLGMLVTISAVWGVQLFVAGMPFLWILISLVSFIFGLAGAYLLLPHVAKRINSFLDPENNENYQVTKSLLAFENGGFYGRGPGEGTVKQVLPDSHTDFIFAVAGEEFGAVACLLIGGIFAFIVIRGLLRVMNETDRFVSFAVVGILGQFGIQSLINMGVTLNLLPTKGMTLPFISYGGSSTLAVAVAMGMLIGFTKRTADLKKFKLNKLEVVY
jgi:cell division protein FtsW